MQVRCGSADGTSPQRKANLPTVWTPFPCFRSQILLTSIGYKVPIPGWKILFARKAGSASSTS